MGQIEENWQPAKFYCSEIKLIYSIQKGHNCNLQSFDTKGYNETMFHIKSLSDILSVGFGIITSYCCQDVLSNEPQFISGQFSFVLNQ